MTRNLSIYTFVFLVFIAFSGCKKDDENISGRDALLQGKWKLTAFTISPGVTLGGATITDLYSQEIITPTYTKDDVTIFKSDGTYQIEENAQKPTPTSPAINETGTWTLSSDEKSLRLQSSEAGSTPENYTITVLTKSEIKATIPFTFTGDPVTYTGSVTFKN